MGYAPLMLAALALFAASQALHSGTMIRLSSCVFLLAVPGFQMVSILKPHLRRWVKALPNDAQQVAARAGHAEFLPVATSVTATLSLHYLGVLRDSGVDSVSIALGTLSLLVFFLSVWFQLHWLWVIIRFVFPYLTWGGPEHDEGLLYIDAESGKPLIALSIDDVPCTHEKFGTSDIEACLELLDKHGARATLFVMSQELPKHDKHHNVSAALSKAVSRGYELGNHDLLDVKTVMRSRSAFTAAVRECDERIEELVEQAGGQWQGWRAFGGGAAGADASWQEGRPQAGKKKPKAGAKTGMDVATLAQENRYRDPLALATQGKPIKWFRPGGGFFRHEMVSIAAEHGYSTVLGNCFSIDTHMPQWHNEWYYRNRAKPGKIIVIHDRPKLLPTLEALLPDLCAKYKVVTLSTLFHVAAKAKQGAGPELKKSK